MIAVFAMQATGPPGKRCPIVSKEGAKGAEIESPPYDFQIQISSAGGSEGSRAQFRTGTQ